MYCTKDCACSLCRELHGYKLTAKQAAAAATAANAAAAAAASAAAASAAAAAVPGKAGNENFILRRRGSDSLKSFQPQSLKCSEMCQQRELGAAVLQPRVATPSPTPMNQPPPPPSSTSSVVSSVASTSTLPTTSARGVAGAALTSHESKTKPKPNHKVVIYFGDSLANRNAGAAAPRPPPKSNEPTLKMERAPAQLLAQVLQRHHAGKVKASGNEAKDAALPSYIESVDNGVINIKIEGNYQRARALVKTVAKLPRHTSARPLAKSPLDPNNMKNTNTDKTHNAQPATYENENCVGGLETSNLSDATCDWSFVQEWRRSRPTHQLGKSSVLEQLPHKPTQAELSMQNVANVTETKKSAARLCSMSAAPPVLADFRAFNGAHIIRPLPQRLVADASNVLPRTTSQAPELQPKLGELRPMQRLQECHSSSDENRSSGHASMSDTGGHGSSSPGGRVASNLVPLPEERVTSGGIINRSTRSRSSTNHSRPPRHRSTNAKVPWSGSGIEDIKLTIQQLSLRSQTSTSTYSSLSAGSQCSEPLLRTRYGSLETMNTNVTSADEFVWVDSHDRLVELKQPPWSAQCILRVIRNGRCKEHAERLAPEAITRLAYLLQRCLVRIAREVQRLAAGLGLCSKQEIASAFKIVLCPALADSCLKACLSAAAMFAVPGDSALKQSKSARAGLQLSVGRFHRWMADTRLGKFVHEYAAVYLCAGLENFLEELLLLLLLQLPLDGSQLTAVHLEQAIAANADMWGLLQPYAHLNAGRIASGELTMPRWTIGSMLGTRSSSSSSGSGSGHTGSSGGRNKLTSLAQEPCLLATCVGSIQELKDLILRAQQQLAHATLSNAALAALFYFMRCAQLEHGEPSGESSRGAEVGLQELCHERAYLVLPPLVEWLRVACAHAEYRSAAMIDRDDIMQAARLLLPGVDCPVRPIGQEEELPARRTHFLNGVLSAVPLKGSASEDAMELGKRATIALAFKLMLTGRAELLAQASSLLPPTTRFDTLNQAGMTALMIAATRNDEFTIQALLDAGCDANVEVPAIGQSQCPAIHPDTQHWTAVTFAACCANYLALRVLLERGGRVEGGARLSEDKCTLTPVQVACGTGQVAVVSLLLAHGANAFLCTQQRDSMCFAGSAQRGSYSGISVAAAHGQRACLRLLLAHPTTPAQAGDVLSLEEMLAEGDAGAVERPTAEQPLALSKAQIKSLQEAMYHSSENNNLGKSKLQNSSARKPFPKS